MPAADVQPCSRLRGVLIFEQNGALASMPRAFRFQTGSGAMIPSISNTLVLIIASASCSFLNKTALSPRRFFSFKPAR